MSDSDRNQDLPLHNEARARRKWRGVNTDLKRGDNSTGLPVSEVDDAAAADRADQDYRRPGSGRPGDFPPPD
jgi:hypothetical protein